MKLNYALSTFTFLLLSCRLIDTLDKRKEIDICGSGNFYQRVEKVSFDELDRIKNLNGKFVEIEGFLHANFEDNALYPSKISHSMDAIWLNSKLPDSLLDKVNGKKVKVIG